jgi:predicted nucleotidyltransferase
MNISIAAVPDSEIARFCQRWHIRELALFGSALRSDFSPASDVDVLVTFSPEAEWGLLDHVQMQQELQILFHRKVDLISRRALERSRNWLLRQEILSTAKMLFPWREVAHATG